MLALPPVSRAEIEKVATMCEKAICFHWWPKVSVPMGWVHDRNYSVHYNFNALVPAGKSFADAETVMYANAVYRPRVPESTSLLEFVKNDQKGFLENAPNLSIELTESLTTGDGRAAQTWLLSPMSSGQWESVAYLEEPEYYIVFVISSRTEAGLKANIDSFKALVKGYP